MRNYYKGAISQNILRAKYLISRISHHSLPREFHTLAQVCEVELSEAIRKFEGILDETESDFSRNSPELLRRFRREVESLNHIEAYGISALERANTSDEFLNKLIDIIRQEINYPLLPPVVTSLSQQYFQIIPRFNLLFVPPSESDFLLHLPDLYHELAHPLLLPNHNPNVTPFQQSLLASIDSGLAYYDEEILEEERRRSPEIVKYYLINWKKLWWQWAVEFYCDLFAVYTLGPAFVWSHLHLVMKFGQEVYLVPTLNQMSHPSDNARMETMLMALNLIGYEVIANEIGVEWKKLLEITGEKASPEYYRAFPNHLIETVSKSALEGVQNMGCRIASISLADNIHNILNRAWQEFWRDPENYINWESKAVANLKNTL